MSKLSQTKKALVNDTPAARTYFTSSTSSARIAAYQASRNAAALATPTAPAPAEGAVMVSGIDLSAYLHAARDETAMQRFMREDNAIQRFASSPWTARIDKL